MPVSSSPETLAYYPERHSGPDPGSGRKSVFTTLSVALALAGMVREVIFELLGYIYRRGKSMTYTKTTADLWSASRGSAKPAPIVKRHLKLGHLATDKTGPPPRVGSGGVK